MRRSSFAISLLAVIVFLSRAATVSAQAPLADDFNRPDGPVGNGWSTWGNTSEISGGELVTHGGSSSSGGLSRAFPVTFPVTFAFDFRTNASIAGYCDNCRDGGWILGFNDQSGSPSGTSEFTLYQFSGSRPVAYYYHTAGGEVGFYSTVVSGSLQDFSLAPSHVSGTVQADLSSIITVTYPDNSQVVMSTPAPADAIVAPQGALLWIGNGNFDVGPHYFDNIVFTPAPPPAPATFWLGLKNSDDQGTQFDLRVEAYINNALVSVSEMRCITGLTRNPALAKEVTIQATPGAAASDGDLLAVRLLTRIGTNADNTKCPGPGGSHNNATGLRLYFDSSARASRVTNQFTSGPFSEFFLHATTTFAFLDGLAPTGATAKTRDSGSVNFAGGNPWKTIDSWSMTLP